MKNRVSFLISSTIIFETENIHIYFFSETLTEYPHRDIARNWQKFQTVLPTFTSHLQSFGTFENRDNARQNFRGILPSQFENATIIGDSTDIPIQRRSSDSLNGATGVWSRKLGCAGCSQQFSINFIFCFNCLLVPHSLKPFSF
jgi:hypothetical protein